MPKNRLFFLFLLLISITSTFACDACGSGGFYMGAMPQMNRHFVGFRYRVSGFTTAATHEGGSKESYQTAELFARFYPFKRLQVMAFLPYSINQHKLPKQTLQTQGFGDATILLNYQLWNTNSDSSRTFQHTTFLGAGVKMPTGHFQEIGKNGTILTPTFQAGTGSFDMIFTAQHTIRYQKLGLNSIITYKHNTKNSNDYRFGDKANANILLFYVQKIKRLGLMPNAGVFVERLRPNHHNSQIVYGTSGYQVAAQAGLDIYYKNLTLGLNYQQPLKQSYADGMAVASPRFSGQVAFLF